MPRNRWRLRILCEDHRTERFVRRLCERYHVHERAMTVDVAPDGKGAASAWVVRRYPAVVRSRRSRNYQQNLAVLVVVDGDRRGINARQEELAAELASADLRARNATESIVIFVPTWSIETWLAHLCGQPGINETEPLKEHPDLRGMWDEEANEATTIRAAVASWNGEIPPLPSLAAAYKELQDRLGW